MKEEIIVWRCKKQGVNVDCFHKTAKCVFLIVIRDAHLNWITIRNTVFWTVCTPNHVEITVPEVFLSLLYASRKSRSESLCEMTWPLNLFFFFGGGGEGAELVWPSNHFRLYTARCICTKAKECELHACLIGRVPRHSSPAGMQNQKFGRSCVHCVIQNSQLLRSCVHCVTQDAHLESRFKIRTLPSCENSLYEVRTRSRSRWLNLFRTTGLLCSCQLILWPGTF